MDAQDQPVDAQGPVADAGPDEGPGGPPRSVAASVAALEQAERELRGVDRAIERLDADTYGRCAVCEDAIDDADLARDPTETHCRQHRQVP